MSSPSSPLLLPTQINTITVCIEGKEAEGLAHDTIQRVYGALKTMLNYAVKRAVLSKSLAYSKR